MEIALKNIRSVPLLQVVKKILNRHMRAYECGRSNLNFGINDDQSASHGAARSADILASVSVQLLLGTCRLSYTPGRSMLLNSRLGVDFT